MCEPARSLLPLAAAGLVFFGVQLARAKGTKAMATTAPAAPEGDHPTLKLQDLSVQITREAKEGTVAREALFSDLALALAGERRRRDQVLKRLAAAMDWYDANWPPQPD